VLTVAPPSNYDNAGLLIRIDPGNVFFHVGDMQYEAQAIGDAITAIVGIWNNLRLGWVGTTAAEAQDFNTRWVAAVQALFGTSADPKSGALPRIADAVAYAAINYGEAEDSNQKMFQSLTNDLNSPPGTPPPPTRDQNQGPITENAPAPP
jgi:hypothetical protein